MRGRERVRQRGDDRRLGVQDLADPGAGVAGKHRRQLSQGSRVERPGLHAADPERGEPFPQLARGLLGEGDREDRTGLDVTGRHLMGDAPRDGRRLAGPGPGDDGEWAAGRDRGLALRRIQAVEDAVRRECHRRDATGER